MKGQGHSQLREGAVPVFSERQPLLPRSNLSSRRSSFEVEVSAPSTDIRIQHHQSVTSGGSDDEALLGSTRDPNKVRARGQKQHLYGHHELPSHAAGGSSSSISSSSLDIDEVLEVLGFGPWHWRLCLYSGLVWYSDAIEVMLLSYLGPAVRATVRNIQILSMLPASHFTYHVVSDKCARL
jgi:hypothetical protein